ncbi:hypothetical protein HDU67_000650 [Dinochytrium kinnereticum]|nr:hypothetical protein HDU67_000650 [Dinochytrium kinnereticum]
MLFRKFSVPGAAPCEPPQRGYKIIALKIGKAIKGLFGKQPSRETVVVSSVAEAEQTPLLWPNVPAQHCTPFTGVAKTLSFFEFSDEPNSPPTLVHVQAKTTPQVLVSFECVPYRYLNDAASKTKAWKRLCPASLKIMVKPEPEGIPDRPFLRVDMDGSGRNLFTGWLNETTTIGVETSEARNGVKRVAVQIGPVMVALAGVDGSVTMEVVKLLVRDEREAVRAVRVLEGERRRFLEASGRMVEGQDSSCDVSGV